MHLVRSIALVILLSVVGSTTTHANNDEPVLVCKAGMYTSWHPDIFWENGLLKGPLYEYISKRLKEVNIELSVQPKQPRNRMLRNLLNGDIDLILTSVYTEERQRLYSLSPVLYIPKLGLVGYREIATRELDTLTAVTINFLKDDAHVQALISQGVSFTFVQSVKRAVYMLETGLTDSIYVNREALISNPAFISNRNIYEESLSYHPGSILEKPLHIMFNKASRCSKRLAELSSNIIKMPYQKPGR